MLPCQKVTVYLNYTWGYTLNEEYMPLCEKWGEENNQGCGFLYFLQTKNDRIWIRSGREQIGEVSLERTKWCFLGLVLFSPIIQATAVCRVSKCFSIKHLFCLFCFLWARTLLSNILHLLITLIRRLIKSCCTINLICITVHPLSTSS